MLLIVVVIVMQFVLLIVSSQGIGNNRMQLIESLFGLAHCMSWHLDSDMQVMNTCFVLDKLLPESAPVVAMT